MGMGGSSRGKVSWESFAVGLRKVFGVGRNAKRAQVGRNVPPLSEQASIEIICGPTVNPLGALILSVLSVPRWSPWRV